MIRISKLADYASTIMAHLADVKSAQNSAEIAEATHLPLPTVRKVMKLLLAANLVSSSRGAEGGYALSLAPENISLGAIVEAIDGPLALTDCCAPLKDCEQIGNCHSQSTWQTINAVVKKALYSVYLKQTVSPLVFHPKARS